MTPEQEAKCREAFEAWLLNGNRFCCEPKDIFTAGYQAAWSAAQAQWLPIESAPKNESVLVFIPRAEHYGAGVYRGLLVDMGTGKHWQVNGLHMGRDCPHDMQPTRWQPLPTPPAQTTTLTEDEAAHEN